MSVHIANNKILKIVFFPLIWFAKWLGEHNPELLIHIRYYVRFHKKLNLNNPHTLNEKILYLSLRTDTSMWTQLADKYNVRNYIDKCNLHSILVNLYAYWKSDNDVNFTNLPDQFVIKSVQGSGDVIIVDDKSKINHEYLRKLIHSMMKDRYGALEGGSHYLRITPGVIVEELLSVSDRQSSLSDYKIWCVNGIPQFIWLCRNRDVNGTDVMLYDTKWNAHPEYSVFNKSYRQDILVNPPVNLDGMLSVAEKLSKPFPIVRVDLYNIGGKIYFGEMTFTSYGGLMDFYTDTFQNLMGSMIDVKYKG